MNSLSEHIRSLAQSSTTPQTLIDIAEDVQELEAENARLREWQKEAREENARLEKAWLAMYERCFNYEVELGLRKPKGESDE